MKDCIIQNDSSHFSFLKELISLYLALYVSKCFLHIPIIFWKIKMKLMLLIKPLIARIWPFLLFFGWYRSMEFLDTFLGVKNKKKAKFPRTMYIVLLHLKDWCLIFGKTNDTLFLWTLYLQKHRQKNIVEREQLGVVSIHHFWARARKRIRDDVKKYRIPRALGRRMKVENWTFWACTIFAR